MVSNGYITYEAFHDIYDHIDAANIDLKAFTENFYGKITLTHLQPVLETLKWLKNETNVWFEITNLMIPTLNDDPAETRKLSEWILSIWGRTCHCTSRRFIRISNCRISRGRRRRRCTGRGAIALEAGLHYVYEGNIYSDGANTSCPSCKAVLVGRSWHNVMKNRLTGDGRCPKCGCAVAGRWVNPRHAGQARGATAAKVAGRASDVADEKYSDLNL